MGCSKIHDAIERVKSKTFFVRICMSLDIKGKVGKSLRRGEAQYNHTQGNSSHLEDME